MKQKQTEGLTARAAAARRQVAQATLQFARGEISGAQLDDARKALNSVTREVRAAAKVAGATAK